MSEKKQCICLRRVGDENIYLRNENRSVRRRKTSRTRTREKETPNKFIVSCLFYSHSNDPT